jgi:hypothetical protein
MIDELYTLRTELDQLRDDLQDDHLDESRMWALAEKMSRILEDSAFNPLEDSEHILRTLHCIVDKLIREQEMARNGACIADGDSTTDRQPIADSR